MMTYNKLNLLTGVAAFAFTIGLLFEPSDTYAAGSFIDAYQKEYAFLQAEKDSLKKRLTEMDAELVKKEAAAKSELSALESKLLYIQDRSDSMEMDLDETTSDRSDMEERMDILKETISRAKDTLEGYGLELTKASENADVLAKQVVNTLSKSVDAMKTGREVSVNDGEFFNLKGKKIKGKIVKIGHIAAYGVSDDGSGALAPAGAGGLKLWNSTTAGDAKAIMGNNIPKELSMFLYESIDKPVEHKAEKTWREIVDSGGVIAWIIVGLGIIAMIMVLLRLIILTMAGRRTESLIKKIGKFVDGNKIDEAVAYCKKAKGATSSVLLATLNNLHKDREKLDDIVSEAILNQTPSVERFGTSILVAASVAPLLGLLGTVTGMISTFDIITEHGTGDPKLLSGGISEALVTTELGLIVAIPTLLIGTLLSGRASAIMDAMERAALQVINKDDLRRGKINVSGKTSKKEGTASKIDNKPAGALV